MKIRKVFASLAVLGTAFMGTVLVPGTASASTGGGCGSDSYEGSSAEACISASGAYLEPDGYIVKNTGCAAAYLSLDDETTGIEVAEHSVGCSLGHKGPFAYKGINGHEYGVALWMNRSDGSVIVFAGSPNEFFSD